MNEKDQDMILETPSFGNYVMQNSYCDCGHHGLQYFTQGLKEKIW